MKKSVLSTTILIVVFLAGLSLLLYPTVSDYWNSLHQTRAINEYVQQAAELDNEEYEQFLADARSYNQSLLGKAGRFQMSDEEREEYESLLNVSGNGILGYIEITKIGCSLPIYHGTSEAVLQIAVGHLEGSSLPVGGESTHCVLTGHRGLPSAKLFTDLDQLVEGDTFVLRALNETMTYEVDQILIVEPDDLSALTIEEGKDYCTLVTCTPYGINTHRLLVRGHRIENAEENEIVIANEAYELDPIMMAPVVAAPLLIFLLIILLVKYRKPKEQRKSHKGGEESGKHE